MSTLTTHYELTDEQFQKIAGIVRSTSGISFSDRKRALVQARLCKRLRRLELDGFDEYLEHLHSDRSGREIVALLDEVSTNQTSFFREPDHFLYLAHQFLPELIEQRHTSSRRLRIWSAGCAAGCEAYSIACTIADALPNAAAWDVAILATDISTRSLNKARQGVYENRELASLPPSVRERWFDMIGSGAHSTGHINRRLRRWVHVDRLNLMEPWPMRGPFDAIFCRNVMIYFDKPTQGQLVNRFQQLLAPGGVLFLGHSESLAGVTHQMQYAQPSVYRRL